MQDFEQQHSSGTWRTRAASAVLGLMGLTSSLSSSSRSGGDTVRPLVRRHGSSHCRRTEDVDVRERRKKRAQRALHDCGLD
ncbi:hypothetical protein pqer_cds_149 [Pandoravirus quercus]|uniref:Uncharacterized protein n=2 Tax=Pandoravirus TaxID=2060084 RepID=A0A2U7U809_9VIRU|nr:hypothetical protein pqer_cds_149 [Pandoravirus quercus]AVK74571.1 hypothetical protein pqer_cds_149 [Pandoravirus quercus]QBZ80751.1 hypothetical protein pclt_cds_153 [Pandoravirus celtis]